MKKMRAEIKVDVTIALQRKDYNKLQDIIDELTELQRQIETVEEASDLTDLLDKAIFGIHEFCEDDHITILN
jgi:hypothetical protein